jgi:hypothetical protein
MVLKQNTESIARWGKEEDRWIFEDRTRYCWTDIKGLELSNWFPELNDALAFAINQKL